MGALSDQVAAQPALPRLNGPATARLMTINSICYISVTPPVLRLKQALTNTVDRFVPCVIFH